MVRGGGIDGCHCVADFRELARRRLPGALFHFLEGGADDETTLNSNSRAFDKFQLKHNCLVDVSAVDTSVRILGQRLDWPVLLSPTGMSRFFHPGGELAVARAAAKSGTLFTLSAMATESLEDIAAIDGPKMFQIYVFRDRALTLEFIDRCRAAKYDALCLTVDVPVVGNRERDLKSGMTVPPHLTARSFLEFVSHPGWCLNYLRGPKPTIANVAHKIAEGSRSVSSIAQYTANQFDPSVTWDDAAEMAAAWGGPFAIKGLLSANDARRAAEIGATAIIVSNHGGRQLDGVPAAIDCLGPIVDAVGDRMEVILDSGIRRGTHVLKALAIGADACMIGRPYLYGLAAGGEKGVDRVLAILQAEIVRGLRLLGCPQTRQLDRQHIQLQSEPTLSRAAVSHLPRKR